MTSPIMPLLAANDNDEEAACFEQQPYYRPFYATPEWEAVQWADERSRMTYIEVRRQEDRDSWKGIAVIAAIIAAGLAGWFLS